MTNLKAVQTTDGATPFGHRTVTLHGVEYQLEELNARDYDECTEMAATPDGGTDSVVLLKVMLTRSLTSPKLSEKQILDMPMSVRRSLLREVNALHFGEVETPAEPGKDSQP